MRFEDSMKAIDRLNAWYAAQCNGSWEHQAGIRIESCDNPGWWVKINLKGTALGGREFARHAEGVDNEHWQIQDDWIDCYIKDGEFIGAGSPQRLEEILNRFLDWAETK